MQRFGLNQRLHLAWTFNSKRLLSPEVLRHVTHSFLWLILRLKNDLLDLQDALCQGSDAHSVGSNSVTHKSSQSSSECDAQKLIITEDDSVSNNSGDSLDLLQF